MNNPRRLVSTILCLALPALPLTTGSAQTARRNRSPSVEGRADAIIASFIAVHLGIGVTAPVGTYLRSGLVAGVGASDEGISGRIDFLNRFHLDPFRESRWAPYAGGGVSMRFDDNRRDRLYLLLLVGVDGPVSRGLATSFEAGLGGGGRIGVIIRRGRAGRR